MSTMCFVKHNYKSQGSQKISNNCFRFHLNGVRTAFVTQDLHRGRECNPGTLNSSALQASPQPKRGVGFSSIHISRAQGFLSTNVSQFCSVSKLMSMSGSHISTQSNNEKLNLGHPSWMVNIHLNRKNKTFHFTKHESDIQRRSSWQLVPRLRLESMICDYIY